MKTINEKLCKFTEEIKTMYQQSDSHFDISGFYVTIYAVDSKYNPYNGQRYSGKVVSICKEKDYSTTIIFEDQKDKINLKGSNWFNVEMILDKSQYIEFLNRKKSSHEKEAKRLNVVMENLRIRDHLFAIRQIEKELQSIK